MCEDMCPNCLSEICPGAAKDGIVYDCERSDPAKTLRMNGINWCQFACDCATEIFKRANHVRIEGLTSGPMQKLSPSLDFDSLEALRKWSDKQIATEIELFEGLIHAS